MFGHQKHDKTIASLSSIQSNDRQFPSLTNITSPRANSNSRNNLDSSFSNNLPTLNNNKYVSPFHDKSKSKIVLDNNVPMFNPQNPGFGTSKLLTSVKPKQETRPKILGFNVGLKHTPQPIGSQSPQNNNSTSFSDGQSQLMKNRSPTNKPSQIGGGLPLSFVHSRRNYAPEHIQTEPSMRSEVTGVYQQTAKHLLDVRIEQQPSQGHRHHPLMHANSYSNVVPQRPMMEMTPQHSQPAKLTNSHGPSSYNHIPSYSDLTPVNNHKSAKKAGTIFQNQTQPTIDTFSDYSNLTNQDRTVVNSMLEARKSRATRRITTPMKDKKLGVNDLKEQSASNNSIFSNLLSPKNSMPRPSIEAPEDFTSVLGEEKEPKKKHPKLKLIIEESRPILRSRADSLNTPRSNRSDSRRVTFSIEGPKKMRLRTVLWTLTFGTVMLKTATKWIQKRKVQRCKMFTDEYQRNRDIIFAFTLAHLKEPLLKMAKEKKPLHIVGSKASLSDINGRCMKIHDYIVSTLEGLLLGLNADKFPQIFFISLVSLIEKSAVIPDFYLTDFELRRLEFTYGGTLRNTNEMRGKLLIGGYILIRILLQEIIMRPWQVLPNVKMEKVNQRNLLNIGSIFYHALMDIFKIKVLLLKENQSYIPIEDRVKPTKKMVQATDKPIDDGISDEVLKHQEPQTNDVILGFYPRPLLEGIIKDRFVLYQDIKDCLEDVMEIIYKKVLAVYTENKKDYNDGYHKKKR